MNKRRRRISLKNNKNEENDEEENKEEKIIKTIKKKKNETKKVENKQVQEKIEVESENQEKVEEVVSENQEKVEEKMQEKLQNVDFFEEEEEKLDEIDEFEEDIEEKINEKINDEEKINEKINEKKIDAFFLNINCLEISSKIPKVEKKNLKEVELKDIICCNGYKMSNLKAQSRESDAPQSYTEWKENIKPPPVIKIKLFKNVESYLKEEDFVLLEKEGKIQELEREKKTKNNYVINSSLRAKSNNLNTKIRSITLKLNPNLKEKKLLLKHLQDATFIYNCSSFWINYSKKRKYLQNKLGLDFDYEKQLNSFYIRKDEEEKQKNSDIKTRFWNYYYQNNSKCFYNCFRFNHLKRFQSIKTEIIQKSIGEAVKTYKENMDRLQEKKILKFRVKFRKNWKSHFIIDAVKFNTSYDYQFIKKIRINGNYDLENYVANNQVEILRKNQDFYLKFIFEISLNDKRLNEGKKLFDIFLEDNKIIKKTRQEKDEIIFFNKMKNKNFLWFLSNDNDEKLLKIKEVISKINNLRKEKIDLLSKAITVGGGGTKQKKRREEIELNEKTLKELLSENNKKEIEFLLKDFHLKKVKWRREIFGRRKSFFEYLKKNNIKFEKNKEEIDLENIHTCFNEDGKKQFRKNYIENSEKLLKKNQEYLFTYNKDKENYFKSKKNYELDILLNNNKKSSGERIRFENSKYVSVLDTFNFFDKFPWCCLDVGIREFATLLSEKGIISWGNEYYRKILLKLNEIDKFQSDIDNLKNNYYFNKKFQKFQKKLEINKIRRKIRNKIHSFHYKLINFLIRNFKLIIIPRFDSRLMIRKKGRKLRKVTVRGIQLLSHCNFLNLLEKKALMYGVRVLEVAEDFTSKTCSNCGRIKENLDGSKTFHCFDKNTKTNENQFGEWCCGLEADRDGNASKNILIKSLNFLHKKYKINENYINKKIENIDKKNEKYYNSKIKKQLKNKNENKNENETNNNKKL